MSKQPIQLSDHFTFSKLFRFTIAPIITMVFTSIYSVVDGYFVSNYVGSVGFASLNLVYPALMMLSAVGFMFGSGGSALVSMTLGAEKKEKANEYFSLLVYVVIALGLLLSAILYYFSPNISLLLGASEEMLPYCVLYLRINLFGMIFFMLQNMFQTFLIVAEKPKLGLIVTLIAGINNMVLDFVLVGVFKFGLAGAAWATVISQMLGGLIPLFYFCSKKATVIHLGKTKFEIDPIWKASSNGVSEFLSNISASFIGMLYNLQLLKYAGENGVSAYGVIMYVSFIFVAIFIGYTMGISPIVGYHYGANNQNELKNVFRKSLIIILIANITMTLLAEGSRYFLVDLFVGYDQELFDLTLRGMQIYSLSFLMLGFNIFASAFFTALNNGKISAILSVSRTLVFQIIMIYLLPYLFGVDGLWYVVIGVEGLGLCMSFFFLHYFKNDYGY